MFALLSLSFYFLQVLAEFIFIPCKARKARIKLAVTLCVIVVVRLEIELKSVNMSSDIPLLSMMRFEMNILRELKRKNCNYVHKAGTPPQMSK